MSAKTTDQPRNNKAGFAAPTKYDTNASSRDANSQMIMETRLLD